MTPLEADPGELGRKWLSLPILAIGLAAALAGCGPARSGAALEKAERELARIESQGIGARAPYEVQAARCTLEQARRKWAVSRYEISIRYAELALKWTREAEGNAIQQAAADRAPAPTTKPEGRSE